MFPGRHRLGDGAGGTVHTPPVLWAQTVTNAEVTMSFGGEYLFPEKWKIINDTPDDGQLSKTEKIRRGEVEFHRKTFVDDDWKYHHGRARQATCMEAMEKVRLDPLGPDPRGADAPGFRARARKEYFDNRAAQAQNRVPQVMPFHTAPAPGWVPPKAAVALEQLAAAKPAAGRRSSSGSAASATRRSSIGSMASGGSAGEAAGRRAMVDSLPAAGMPAAGRRAGMNRAMVVDGRTSGGWQGWDSSRAIDAYAMGRAEQKRNRWANDTPSYSLPK